MQHEDFPVVGFEFMNEPATVEQKEAILVAMKGIGIDATMEGPWPPVFSKWDAGLMLEALTDIRINGDKSDWELVPPEGTLP